MKLDSNLDTNFRQFKLGNGEEILCEIVQWSDDEQPAIIVRKAMKIFQVDRVDGFRMYTLRPWMMYAEDPDQLMTINDNQIIGECTPAKPLMDQYTMVVSEHKKSFLEELEKTPQKDRPFPHNLSDEKLEELMLDIADSTDSNIVDINSFKLDRSKMH